MDKHMLATKNNNSDQTLHTIGQIDGQIQSIYTDLEALSVQSNPDINKQNQMLQKIQELQQLKTSLYTSLSSRYANAQSNVAISRNSLVNEMAIGGIVESELANVQSNLSALQDNRNNKLRMAEINTYYSDKYDTQSNVMKTIVYFCIPILILGILTKNDMIPSSIAVTLISILTAIAIVVVVLQVIDIMRRDNMNFSEYRFPFDPNTVDVSRKGKDSDQPVKLDLSMVCIGEACCPTGNTYGTMWDSTNQQCVTQTKVDTTSESFVGERCLQNVFGKCDSSVNVFKKNVNVSGYSGNNNDNYAKF